MIIFVLLGIPASILFSVVPSGAEIGFNGAWEGVGWPPGPTREGGKNGRNVGHYIGGKPAVNKPLDVVCIWSAP